VERTRVIAMHKAKGSTTACGTRRDAPGLMACPSGDAAFVGCSGVNGTLLLGASVGARSAETHLLFSVNVAGRESGDGAGGGGIHVQDALLVLQDAQVLQLLPYLGGAVGGACRTRWGRAARVWGLGRAAGGRWVRGGRPAPRGHSSPRARPGAALLLWETALPPRGAACGLGKGWRPLLTFQEGGVAGIGGVVALHPCSHVNAPGVVVRGHVAGKVGGQRGVGGSAGGEAAGCRPVGGSREMARVGGGGGVGSELGAGAGGAGGGAPLGRGGGGGRGGAGVRPAAVKRCPASAAAGQSKPSPDAQPTPHWQLQQAHDERLARPAPSPIVGARDQRGGVMRAAPHAGGAASPVECAQLPAEGPWTGAGATWWGPAGGTVAASVGLAGLLGGGGGWAAPPAAAWERDVARRSPQVACARPPTRAALPLTCYIFSGLP